MIADYHAAVARHMSERELMDNVIELAQRLGYLVAHIPDALYRLAATSGRTDASGAKGFLDLWLVGHGRLIVIETKTQRGRVTEEQQQWIAALLDAGVEVHVVRPVDWLNGTVERVLQHGR